MNTRKDINLFINDVVHLQGTSFSFFCNLNPLPPQVHKAALLHSCLPEITFSLVVPSSIISSMSWKAQPRISPDEILKLNHSYLTKETY